jgi:cytidine deaminase
MASEQILSGKDAAAIAATCEAHGITTTEFAQLQRRATAAKATAYCPYSQFRVGATLLSNKTGGEEEEDGQYISGANVENASYPVGTCAERVALGKAVTEGHRGFRAVAVATDISPPASPCGMCRQL